MRLARCCDLRSQLLENGVAGLVRRVVRAWDILEVLKAWVRSQGAIEKTENLKPETYIAVCRTSSPISGSTSTGLVSNRRRIFCAKAVGVNGF